MITKEGGLILGLSIGFAVLVSFLVCIFLLIRRSSEGRNSKEPSTASFNEGTTYHEFESSRTANATQVGECKIKVETKAKKVKVEEMAITSQRVIKRSGSLVFCAGESEVFYAHSWSTPIELPFPKHTINCRLWLYRPNRQ